MEAPVLDVDSDRVIEGITSTPTDDEAQLAARALADQKRREALRHEAATDGLICSD